MGLCSATYKVTDSPSPSLKSNSSPSSLHRELTVAGTLERGMQL